MNGRNGARRPGGRVAPSRTAAIGGTFVAFTAGASPATRVITTPIRSEMITVRGATISPVVGRSLLTALKNAFSPTASPIPAKSPMIAPTSPITNASIVTEVRICRLEAPIVLRVANSRIRCETVIESVLKITNAPTKSAIVANESRKYLMILVNEADFLASFTCCA